MSSDTGKTKNVLITGSSGFLGRYLIKFAPAGCRLFAQYRTKRPNCYGREVELIQSDFDKEPWTFLNELKPDLIIHTAAMASIDECEMNEPLADRVNSTATRKLAEYAAGTGSRFIFVSSDVVFDGTNGNYSENDTPNPKNVYASTKVAAEKFLLKNLENVVVVRPSLFYGLSLNGRPSFTETMLSSLHAGKQVFLFTDQYRTPLLVNNLADALWELAAHHYTGILHLGNSERVSRFEMGRILCDIFNLDHSLLVPMRSAEANLAAFRPPDCSLNTGLARSLLKTNFVDCRSGFSIAYR